MAGNIYGPNGAFGNLPAAPAQPAATTYNPNWKPGGMYNMGNPGTAAPAPAPVSTPAAIKPLGEVGTTMPTQNTSPMPDVGQQTNTYGPNGAFGASTAPKLDYLSPQDMVTDAIAQRTAPRFRPLGGLWGMGYRQ